MAIHEIYIGGAPTANYSRAMLPAPPFNANSGSAQALKVAAHKGPTSYGLTRDINTADYSLAEFLRENTVAEGDVLGSILIPKDILVKGVYFEVMNPAGEALVITPQLRGVAAATLPTIDGNVAGKGFAMLGGSEWVDETAAVDGDAFFIAEPTVLDLVLTTYTTLGALHLTITPLVDTLYHGRV